MIFNKEFVRLSAFGIKKAHLAGLPNARGSSARCTVYGAGLLRVFSVEYV